LELFGGGDGLVSDWFRITVGTIESPTLNSVPTNRARFQPTRGAFGRRPGDAIVTNQKRERIAGGTLFGMPEAMQDESATPRD
jgi:hypothetical protein